MMPRPARTSASCRSARSNGPAGTTSAAADLLRGGHIGDLRHVQIDATRNIMPGFTQPLDEPPLSPEAWDMWLGPAPFAVRPAPRALPLPLVLGLLGRADDQPARARPRHRPVDHRARAPRVSAFGGRRSLQGFGETPDVFEAIYEFRVPG